VFRLFAHRRRYVWIALLAILWHGLLPLSYASAPVPAQHGEHAACNTTGHHAATGHYDACAAHDDAPVEQHGTHHQSRAHCALCFFDNGIPALHDARDPLVIVSSNTHVQRETVAPHSHMAHVSAPPPSRAPPLQA
jgi:Protein of unknown function (DUF2946).